MSVWLNPSIAGRVLTQLGNGGAWLRGIVRVNSEGFGMPQTVPDDRKMDYTWRDIYMPWANAYLMEVTYRMCEQAYVSPNFKKVLDMRHLGVQGIPQYLSSRMMGSLVNPRSYYMVPDLLESQEIPRLMQDLEKLRAAGPAKAQARAELSRQLAEVQKVARHLRTIVNPTDYLDLHMKGQLQPREIQNIKNYLKLMQRLADGAAKAEDKQIWRNAMAAIAKKNPNAAERQKLVREAAAAPLQKLRRTLQRLAKLPALQGNAWVQEMARLDEAQLLHRFHPPASAGAGEYFKQLRNVYTAAHFKRQGTARGMFDAVTQPFVATAKAVAAPFAKLWKFVTYKRTTPEQFLEQIHHNIITPLARQNKTLHGNGTALSTLLELSAGRTKLAQLNKVFEGSAFWLKLPISILGIFLMYGLLANTFDAKFVQPYQREVSKKIGDVRDIILPGFLGIIPGGITFYALNKIPQIKRLGYISSFAVVGAGALAAFFATAALGFQALTAKRMLLGQTKPKAEAPKKPVAAQAVRPRVSYNVPPTQPFTRTAAAMAQPFSAYGGYAYPYPAVRYPMASYPYYYSGAYQR